MRTVEFSVDIIRLMTANRAEFFTGTNQSSFEALMNLLNVPIKVLKRQSF